MSFAVRRVDDPAEKSACVRSVLAQLPEWFGDAADYAPYERKRRFYRHMRFEALLTLKEMWDEDNPCLVMVKLV